MVLEILNDEHRDMLKELVYKHISRGAPDQCWVWTGLLRNGVPHFLYVGNYYKTQRILWVLERGKLPHKSYVVNDCPITMCMNINHLKVVPWKSRDYKRLYEKTEPFKLVNCDTVHVEDSVYEYFRNRIFPKRRG
jgi:hypothetical protein